MAFSIQFSFGSIQFTLLKWIDCNIPIFIAHRAGSAKDGPICIKVGLFFKKPTTVSHLSRQIWVLIAPRHQVLACSSARLDSTRRLGTALTGLTHLGRTLSAVLCSACLPDFMLAWMHASLIACWFDCMLADCMPAWLHACWLHASLTACLLASCQLNCMLADCKLAWLQACLIAC